MLGLKKLEVACSVKRSCRRRTTPARVIGRFMFQGVVWANPGHGMEGEARLRGRG